MRTSSAASTSSTPFTVIVDYSDFIMETRPQPATLLLRCRSCRQPFFSDYEEPRCGYCVKKREQPEL